MQSIRKHLLLLAALPFMACGDDDSDRSMNRHAAPFPESPTEIQAAVKTTADVAVNSEVTIERFIQAAFDDGGRVDPEAIASMIQKIEGVRSAEPTPQGTGIVVEQEDGSFSNVLLVSEDDSRLFQELGAGKTIGDWPGRVNHEQDHRRTAKPAEFSGAEKAVILAPFQRDFDTDLSAIRGALEAGGFAVTTYVDEEASLDRFRGSYLQQFDVVFIRSHGAANFRTRGGTVSTVFLTGEHYTFDSVQSLSGAEQKAVAVASHDSISYFAFSVPWLQNTASGRFQRSWIYVGGCETAMVDNGSASLSEAFFDLGAGAYNGFDATIATAISNPVAEKMSVLMSSGKAITDAAQATRSDLGLRTKAWFLRVVGGNESANVDLLDDLQRLEEPYYLFDPEHVIASGAVLPASGSPGTDIVFEVYIREVFADRVSGVEFDIDNTGEHIVMEEAGSGLWRRDELSAPTAATYPRVDTFTFTATDTTGNVVATGSATFTIQEPRGKLATHSVGNYATD